MHLKQYLYPSVYKLPGEGRKMQVVLTTLKCYIDRYHSHWKTLLYMSTWWPFYWLHLSNTLQDASLPPEEPEFFAVWVQQGARDVP